MMNIKAKSQHCPSGNTSRHYYRETELVRASNFNIRVTFFDRQTQREDGEDQFIHILVFSPSFAYIAKTCFNHEVCE